MVPVAVVEPVSRRDHLCHIPGVRWEHMFDQTIARLDALLEELDVPAEGDAIGAYFARIHRFVDKGAIALGTFAADGGPQRDGAVTLKSWLVHRLGLDPAAAAHLAAQATKLHRLPVLQDAFASGSLGSAAIETVLGHLPKRHVERFADHEAELVPTLVGLE